MGSKVGVNFLNTFLSGLIQSAQLDDDLVVRTTSEIRMADPQRVSFTMDIVPSTEASGSRLIAGTRSVPVLDKEEKKPEVEDKDDNNDEDEVAEGGHGTGVLAGVRMPAATVASIPSLVPAPMLGSRVDAATRQTHDYSPARPESPELVPSTPSTAIDYNPEYQNQFDRYLRTRAFNRMYNLARSGVGAPAPDTPLY